MTTPPSDETTAATRSTVQRLLDVVVAPSPGRIETLREVYAPDAVFVERREPAGRIDGVDRILEHLQGTYGRYASTATTIRLVLAEGAEASVLWHMVFREHGAAVERVIEGMAHLRVRGGRIVLHREYYDYLAAFEPASDAASPRPAAAARRPAPGGLPGAPRCLGGAPVRARRGPWPGRCAGCLDQDDCAGPGGLGPGLLRPRFTTDPLADVLGVLGALGPVEPAVARGLASLHAMLPGDRLASATLELSCKLRGDEIVQWPRVTCYEARGGGRRATTLATVAGLAPAGEPGERLQRALAALPLDATLAVGLAPEAGGLAVRVYATPPPAGGEAVRAFLERLGAFAGLEPLLGRRLASVGVSLPPGGGRERVRLYERVPLVEVANDPAGDPEASVAWDVSPDRPPEPTARYVHYLRRHLDWAQAARRGLVGRALGERLGRALFGGQARAYFTFVGVGAGSRTLYFQVGPGVREVAGQ